MNFNALTQYLDQLPSKGIPGCDLMIYRNHEPVYRHFSGERDQGVAMRGDETYWLYSASKVITMTACMQLIERGVLHLDDPVSKYLPAYEHLTVQDGDEVRPARTVMLLQHLMAMQGGLNYDLTRPAVKACVKKYGAATTTVQIAEAFAADPLDFDPGTHMRYSLCHDVVAAVVEVASGMQFGEYIQKNIFDPLGIHTLTFHPTEAQLNRLAARYTWNAKEQPIEHNRFPQPYRLSELHESGGAGLMGDVESYALLVDALANDGVGKTGAKILSRESIDQMRTNRQTGACYEDWQRDFNRDGYGYGLGVRTLMKNDHSRSPVGEFGWDGAAGAWTMIDVDNHIGAFYAQHVLSCGRAYSEFHPALRDLIYECLEL